MQILNRNHYHPVVREGDIAGNQDTVLFSNNKYSLENRLVIRRQEMMPDEAGTGITKRMLPSSLRFVPSSPTKDGEEAKGIDIEASVM